MIIYSAIVTGLLSASGYAIYKMVGRMSAMKEGYEAQIEDLQSAVREQQQEIENAYEVIEELEGINNEANKEKATLHNGGSAVDNAKRATDIMSKLSKNGDSNGDETSSGD